MAHNYTVVVNIKHPGDMNRPLPANTDQSVHVVASSPEEAEDRAVARVMAGLFPGQDVLDLPKQMRPRVRSVSKGEAVVNQIPAEPEPPVAPIPQVPVPELPTSISDEDEDPEAEDEDPEPVNQG